MFGDPRVNYMAGYSTRQRRAVKLLNLQREETGDTTCRTGAPEVTFVVLWPVFGKNPTRGVVHFYKKNLVFSVARM